MVTGNIEIRFLLPRETGIWKILGRRATTDGDINVRRCIATQFGVR